MLHLDPASITTASARALIERQLQTLMRLAEIGMEIAESAGRAALAPPTAEPASARDPALTFARVARAVRLTIALQSRLLKDLDALDHAEHAAEAARASARRLRAHRLVEQAIEAGYADGDDDDDGEAIERLSSQAWERLTDIEDADLATRPLNEIVAAICQDLGLPPDSAAAAFAPVAGLDPIAPSLQGAPPGRTPPHPTCLRDARTAKLGP